MQTTAETRAAVERAINERYWNKQVECRECDWTGKFKDANHTDVLPICPKCGEEDSLDDIED